MIEEKSSKYVVKNNGNKGKIKSYCFGILRIWGIKIKIFGSLCWISIL